MASKYEQHTSPEQQHEKPWNNQDITPFNPETQLNKTERVNQERIEETFWDLDTKWEKFKSWDKIDFICMTKEWNKVDCSFDIDKQKLLYDNIEINISMPNWAKISEIYFWNWEITIKWKLWIFSWTWSAKYIDLLKALDEVVINWNSQIVTKKWTIWLKKIPA